MRGGGSHSDNAHTLRVALGRLFRVGRKAEQGHLMGSGGKRPRQRPDMPFLTAGHRGQELGEHQDLHAATLLMVVLFLRRNEA